MWGFFKKERKQQGHLPTPAERAVGPKKSRPLDIESQDLQPVKQSGAPKLSAPVHTTTPTALNLNFTQESEAQFRIARCRETKSLELSLKGLGIKELPIEIEGLSHLTTLDISQNKLHDIAALKGLTALVELNLSENRLGQQPLHELSYLRRLVKLDLSNNGLADDCTTAIAKLRSLEVLNLAGNRVRPTGLKKLNELTRLLQLDVSSNEFGAEGVRALSGLGSLKALNLARNQIGAAGALALSAFKSLESLSLADCLVGEKGAQGLSSLAGLRNLDISGNGVGSEGLRPIANLKNLETLDISSNGINDASILAILHKLRQLNLSNNGHIAGTLHWLRDSLKQMMAYRVSLGQIPAELLSKTPTDNCLPRLQKYLIKSEQDDEPDLELRDIKVMILGNGRVGKTQMRRRLSGLPYDDTIASTHGVEIVEANLSGSDSSSPTPLKIWDFGGQEIYLGTHALFLKTRAVFPILWTPKLETDELQEVGGQLFRNYPLDEWVRYVQALAGERSPVILVQTQCENSANSQAPQVDSDLRDMFAFPIRHLHYSSRTGEGEASLMTLLKAAVAWQATDRGAVRIPASWGRVKAAIEAMHGDPNARRMTKQQFSQLCERVGHERDPASIAVLLDLLHQFGTLFYDEEVFDDLIIIDQNWALQAIYSVFDRSPGGPYYTLRNRMFGRFTQRDLGRLVWDDHYSNAEQDAFIAMMLACSIAFVLREGDKEEETLFIAPELLHERSKIENELAARWDNNAEILSMELPFRFLAPSFLREVMRVWGAIAGQAGLYWRTGLAFYDSETGSRAILEVTRKNSASWAGQIEISTQGGAAELLLSRIADRALDIAERFGAKPEGASAEGANSLGGTPAGARSGGNISTREYLSRRAIRRKSSNPLGDWEQETINPATAPTVRERCFISYSHGDDSAVGKLRAAAFRAVSHRLIELGYSPFFDAEHLSHGESVSAFMKLGSTSPKFVIVLSDKYLRSPFCMDELRRIWRTCGQERTSFQSRIRAVCLPDAHIETVLDREKIRDHWVQERQIWRELKKKREDAGDRLGLEEYHQYDAAENLAETVSSILLDIADTLHIRSLEDIENLNFSN